MDSLNQHIKDQIELYLLGKMAPTEAALFESNISADPVLKQEVDMQRNIIAAIKHARKQELKEYIRSNTGSSATVGSSGFRQMYWYAAAATVLLIVISVTYLKVLHPGNSQESKNDAAKSSAPLANENNKNTTGPESNADEKTNSSFLQKKALTDSSNINEHTKSQSLAYKRGNGLATDSLKMQNNNAPINTYAWSTAPKKDNKNISLKESAPKTNLNVSPNLPSAYNNSVNNYSLDGNTANGTFINRDKDETIANRSTTKPSKKAKKSSFAGRKPEETSNEQASRPFPITGSVIKDTVMFPILIANKSQDEEGNKADSTNIYDKRAKLKSADDNLSKAPVQNNKVIVSYVISPQQKDEYIFNGNWLYIYNEPMKNAVLYNLNGVIFMRKGNIVYQLKPDSKIHRQQPVSNKKILAKFEL